MKLICERAALQDAVSKVYRAVSPKSTIRAIEGILVRASRADGLYLCGYNLDMGITCTVEAVIKEEGKIVIHPAKIFADIVRKLPDERVTIDVKENFEIFVSSGSASFTVSGMKADEFPDLPDFQSENSITLPQKTLRSMINQTIFCISDNIMQPIYTGVKFEIGLDCFRLVALDGFRVAIRTENIKSEHESGFVVPGKTLTEVEKMLSDEEADATVMIARRFVMFRMGNYTLMSRVLEGNFIDYRSVSKLRLNPDVEANINVGRMIEGSERMALMLLSNGDMPVRCYFGEGAIRLECHSDLGEANDSWIENVDFDIKEIWFRNKYILDAFRAVDSDVVKIELGNSEEPMRITPCEGEHYEFYLMPVKQPKR